MDQNTRRAFGLYMRQLREARGLTFEEAAVIFDRCRLTSHHSSDSYLEMVELGQIIPNIFNLKVLADEMYQENYESMKKRASLVED